MTEYYVVVVDNDMPVDRHEVWGPPRGPLVLETYLDNENADIHTARSMAAKLDTIYGGARIAKLVFIDEEGE